MRCPRCGLQNQPAITACARCGLPVPGATGAPAGQPRPSQVPPSQAPSQAPSGPPPQPGRPPQPGQPPQPGRPSPYGQTGSDPRQQGAGQPAHGQPGFGGQQAGQAPSAHGQTAQHGYAQPGYGGTGERPVYEGGGATLSLSWPVTTRQEAVSAARDRGALGATAALALGALLSLVYAVWAFTARRGIFADFSNGITVSGDDAKSSDNIDRILLIVAGILVVIAVALWVMRKVNAKTAGGAVDLGGLVVTGVGVVVVLVGLFLSSTIPDGPDQAAQGDKGVTATLVTGGGFLVIAIGLLIGILAVRGLRERAGSPSHVATASGHRNW